MWVSATALDDVALSDSTGGTPRGPVISVVVPAYNAERFVAETLRSVMAQTFEDWELIVVDDRSTDATTTVARDAIANDPRCRMMTLPQNAGVSVARNAGFLESAGRYTLFLDADDILEPFALRVLLAALDADEASIGAHGVALLVDENGDEKPWLGAESAWPLERIAVESGPGGVRVLNDGESTGLGAIAVGCWIATPGLALLRSAHLNDEAGRHPNWGGPWRPGDQAAADRDLWARLALHGAYKFVRVPVLKYRINSQGLSGQVGMGAMLRREQFLLEEVIARNPEERRLFAVGWRAQSLVRARSEWASARYDLKNRQMLSCARHLWRTLGAGLRFRGLRRLPDWQASAEARMPVTR